MTEAITAAGGRSGAEEILARILENAGQAGDRLLAAADEKTEKILADAAAQAEQIRRKTAEAYAAKAEAALHAAASAAELETRNRLLRERRRILDETLKKTVGYLQGLPDAAYFEALLPLAARSAQAGEGLLLFGAGDLKRLPADFEARLNRSLETGKKLTRLSGGGAHRRRLPAEIRRYRDELQFFRPAGRPAGGAGGPGEPDPFGA